eukprot:4291408-Ditylum_brightwellii.AAC.1
MAMVQLARSKFQVNEIVENIDDQLVVPIRNLLGKSKKNLISKNMLPAIHEALVNFCKEKKILLPFLEGEVDDNNSAISDITTLTRMTNALGHEDNADTNSSKYHSEET